MSEQLLGLLRDPWFYAGLLGIISLSTLAIRRWVQGAVDHRFQQRIESHRHQLQLVAEHEKFRLQRQLAGSSLYLHSQHKAAAEIYSAVRVAHGAVGGLFGAQRGLDLDDCDESDLRELMTSHEVLSGKQEDLIGRWYVAKEQGVEAIKQHLREIQVPRAEARLQDARNLMYVNEIYFSDEAIRSFDKFVGESNKWILRRAFPPERGEKIEPVSRDALNASLEHLQSTLRAELRGDGSSKSALPVNSVG